MKDNLIQTSWQHLKWLRFGLIIVLVLGIFFRFFNIDKKLYSFDEMNTSIRVAGYTSSQLRDQFNYAPFKPLDIQNYRYLSPDKNVINTVNALASQEPQHPPLYYVLARFWVQCFGDSVAEIRSLSAIISLLVFPCIYWLCRELFNSPVVGWLAIGLIAVSPFHMLYAQEARQYSLWTVTILLSSAALLRAMRLKTKLSWGLYGIALALGLYTFPFTVFVAIGHAIYICATERFRLSKNLIAYLLASLGATVAFAPWVWLIITSLDKVNRTTSWVQYRIGMLSVSQKFLANISRIFVDFNRFDEAKLIYAIPWVLIAAAILILVLYSIYFIYSKSSLKVWLFIVTLMTVIPIALFFPDFFIGGKRLSVSRYLIPCYLAIHLSVAYFLAANMTSGVSKKKQHRWRLLTIGLLSSGILCCGISSQAEFWHTKGLDYRPLAEIINQAENPLVISNAGSAQLMALSYLLEPKVRLQLLANSNIPEITVNGFSNVFLYSRSSEELILKFKQEQGYNVEEVKDIRSNNFKIILWKVKNQ